MTKSSSLKILFSENSNWSIKILFYPIDWKVKLTYVIRFVKVKRIHRWKVVKIQRIISQKNNDTKLQNTFLDDLRNKGIQVQIFEFWNIRSLSFQIPIIFQISSIYGFRFKNNEIVL